MLNFIMRKLKYLAMLGQSEARGLPERSPLSPDLETNLKLLQGIFGVSSDFICRRFVIGFDDGVRAAVVFIDGLVDQVQLNSAVMHSLMAGTVYIDKIAAISDLIDYLDQRVLAVGGTVRLHDIDAIADYILSGGAVILVEEGREAIGVDMRGGEKRAVEQPSTEGTVRGPREGFVEDIRTNTAMLRRKIRHPGLTVESLRIGKYTRTEVSIAYIKGLAWEGLIDEIKRRLQRIDIDGVLESGYLEEFIADNPLSPFATVGNAETPDKVAAKLLEGRAAIFVDGTPNVLTVPLLFAESFQVPEDYYASPLFGSAVRLVRYLAYFFSLGAAPLYIALASFHQGLLPSPLLISLAAARENVPFPTAIETTAMLITFEILREAGVRMPQPLGQAVSIVGALVLGQAAVQAGFVSAPVVIVVALTAISTFVVPPQIDSGVIIRFLGVALASSFGLYGIIIGALIVLIHLSSLRSFGTPYFSPFAPLSVGDLKDTLLRAPLWKMHKRPRLIGWIDPERQEPGKKPEPPQRR